jgi:REP element-mobilizing transposase RayT
MTFYSERDGAARPVLQIAMPRLPRLYAPGGTMHVVARCNNREFYFAAPEDFKILLDHLGEMSKAYKIKLFAYSLMSNHLLLQAPAADVLGRPLRWFMTQTAKTFHRLRSRSGHFWERRYRACLVEENLKGDVRSKTTCGEPWAGGGRAERLLQGGFPGALPANPEGGQRTAPLEPAC